jgi:pimeloyl-ACP methyl ester carboxylesterase
MNAEVNGTSLYYEQEGGGPDLLLLPGLGASVGVWYAQLKGLSSMLRVTAADPRGHGRSGRPAGPYSIDLFAEDAAALIRHLGIGPTAVAGSSMSGAVALTLAAKYPELVSHLILVGGFAQLPAAGRERMAARARTVEAEGLEAVVDVVVGAALGAYTHQANPALVGLFRQLLLSNQRESYAAATRAVSEADVTGLLGRVRCPTLILLGAQEQVAPLGCALELKAGIPQAEVKVIPNAGHLPMMEQPGAFNAAVIQFLGGTR